MKGVCSVCQATLWDSQLFYENGKRFCQFHYREHLLAKGQKDAKEREQAAWKGGYRAGFETCQMMMMKKKK